MFLILFLITFINCLPQSLSSSLSVVIPIAETDLRTTDILTSSQFIWSWFQQMFLTILSLGISVQLLFGLNAPFICVVKVFGARHMTHTWPQLQQQKASNSQSCGCRNTTECWQCAGAIRDLGHSPASLLLLFAEDGYAAHYIKSEIHVLIYAYGPLPRTGMKVMYTGPALL